MGNFLLIRGAELAEGGSTEYIDTDHIHSVVTVRDKGGQLAEIWADLDSGPSERVRGRLLATPSAGDRDIVETFNSLRDWLANGAMPRLESLVEIQRASGKQVQVFIDPKKVAGVRANSRPQQMTKPYIELNMAGGARLNPEAFVETPQDKVIFAGGSIETAMAMITGSPMPKLNVDVWGGEPHQHLAA